MLPILPIDSINFVENLVLKETNKKIPFIDEWPMVILFCLTLGLAPFVPEPHIYGKIKWLLGGGIGMKPMDYLDFVYHSIPFVLLIRLGYKTIKNKYKIDHNE
ncbi:MAG: hypothetical protein WAT79_07455 [Saprospiraceae bacterium]